MFVLTWYLKGSPKKEYYINSVYNVVTSYGKSFVIRDIDATWIVVFLVYFTKSVDGHACVVKRDFSRKPLQKLSSNKHQNLLFERTFSAVVKVN